MESSSAIARSYTPQKSKKRMYSESSSSCAEPEVIEIAPPLADQASRMKAKGKQKEVAYHEIIDVDMDEDYNDVVLLEGKVESNRKRKRSTGISLGPSSSENLDLEKVASNKKGKEISVDPDHPSKGFNPGSNNFFDLDDYVFDEDYWTMQSHFDNIGLPAGIEVPFPWLPESGPINKDNPAIPFETSNAHLKASVSQLNKVDPMSTPTVFSSSKKSTAVHKHVPAQTMHSNFTQIGSGNYLSNTSSSQVGNGPSNFPQLAMNTAYPLGMSNLHESVMKNIVYPQLAMNTAGMSSGAGGMFSMNDMILGQDATGNGPSSISLNSVKSSSSMAKLVDSDVKKRHESFKKFDTVVDLSGHHYAKQKSAVKQPPKNWAKRIQEEWKILEKDLPDTIFVRVYESRMDLLRAVIIGAEGTPYHDGLFFFDVCFPSSYPNSPPLVHYHSGGLRINPNLYNCGKVCLSLLNTWSGGQKERWVPGTSTMLQVLVSIQGLILNMKPYFNEPGFAHSNGSAHGEKSSLQYNENTLILSLKTMVYTMNKPPKHFEDLVIGHFQHRVRDILMACKAYTEGVQVGCLVKGGVQDVDEGSDSCSPMFKHNVRSYIKALVAAFKKIGAKEAQEFLFLSVKESPVLAAPNPRPGLSQNPNPNPNPSHPFYPAHGYPPPFSSNSIAAAFNQHW